VGIKWTEDSFSNGIAAAGVAGVRTVCLVLFAMLKMNETTRTLIVILYNKMENKG
jgi:hypothetical protein